MTPAINKILLLCLAGSAGTLSRYFLSGLAQKILGSDFPWGTLTVNTVGCLLAGFFYALTEEKLQLSAETRAIVMIGFFGAFTTFSAYLLETGNLMRDAEWIRALANLLGQNLAGGLALIVGFALSRLI